MAVTRKPLGEPNAMPYLPSESLTLEEAVESYTLGAAYVNFLEDVTGSITVGKYADLILLDKNIFKMKAEDIHTAKVLRTFIAGTEVYRRA